MHEGKLSKSRCDTIIHVVQNTVVTPTWWERKWNQRTVVAFPVEIKVVVRDFSPTGS